MAKESKKAPEKKLPEISEFWAPAKEIAHEQGLKILIWGREEVGKTYFCLSAPPPVYIVDTESPLALS